MLCLISYTVLQLRVRDFSALVCGVARVAVLFVEVHLLMVIIPMLAGAEDPRYFILGRKQPPPPTNFPHTNFEFWIHTF